MKEVLIKNYATRTETPDCHPGSTSFNVFVSFDDDISAVLPYLNAELSGALDYRHKDRILLWEGEGKRHAFRAREMAISTFQDDEDSDAYVRSLVDKINDIWSRRSELTPSEEGLAPMPKALDIWKLLPRTNCKKCGFPTCMAYAVAVREDRSRLADCEHLSDEDLRKVTPDD